MNRSPKRDKLLQKITFCSQKAGLLSRQVRELVFGFRPRSTLPFNRCSLPVKLAQDHHLTQRQHVFQQAGGHGSSVALYGLNKARQQRP
jgi:hypothetical protein